MDTPLPAKLLTEMTDKDLKDLARDLLKEHKGDGNVRSDITFKLARDRKGNIKELSINYYASPAMI